MFFIFGLLLFLVLFFRAITSSRVTYSLGHKDDTQSSCAEPHPRLLYRFKPFCREWILRAGSRSHMTYNSMGLRDKEYSARPLPGWRRILFIGFSGLVGPGLPEMYTPPRMLEKYLRKNYPRTEVINGGVEGYSSWQVAVFLPELIKKYSPTHVVFWGNFSNIAVKDIILRNYLVQNGTDMHVDDPVSRYIYNTPLLNRWVTENPGPRYALLNTAYRAFLRLQNGYRCKYLRRGDLGRARCYLAASVQAIETINIAAERAGAKFLYLYFPFPISNRTNISPGMNANVMRGIDFFTPTLRLDASLVEDLLASKEIPYMKLDKRMTALALRLPRDNHFNKKGSEAFGKYLVAEIPADFWQSPRTQK